MKKKILGLALATAIVLPLTLTACGGDGDHAISAEKWQQMCTTEHFQVRTTDGATHSGDDVFTNGYKQVDYELIYSRGVIDHKHSWYNSEGAYNSNFFTCVKEGTGAQTTYKYYGGVSYDEPTTSTEQEYNAVISNFIAVINYVKDNQSAFTFYNRKYSTGYYQMDVADTEIADEVADILADAYVKNDGLILAVTDGCIDICSNFIEFDNLGNVMNEGVRLMYITFGEQMTSYFWNYGVDKDVTNFVIKCVDPKDANSPDALEYYFEENGFRLYTPNLPDPTRNDGYFCYDEKAGVYKSYRQDENHEWSFTEINESVFTAQRTSTYNFVLGYILKNSASSFIFDGEYICQQSWLVFQRTEQGIKYTTQNFKMTVDENGKITGATWNLYYEWQGQRSPTYNYTLTVGNVVLNYPNVG